LIEKNNWNDKRTRWSSTTHQSIRKKLRIEFHPNTISLNEWVTWGISVTDDGEYEISNGLFWVKKDIFLK
jgi:hypothetical protein